MSRFQFVQRKDHFQTSNTDTFIQYGYVDNSFFEGSHTNLILTLIGNSIITTSEPFPEPVRRIANETGALLLGLEMRYFGNSTIFPNTSTNNLEFLTIEQIHADIATVLTFYQAQCNGGSCRTLIVGAGETAEMAAWFRMRYPQFSIGVWASFAMTDTPIFDYSCDQRIIARLERNGKICLGNTQKIMKSLDWSMTVAGESEKRRVLTLFDMPNVSTQGNDALYMFSEMFVLLDDLPDGNQDLFEVYCDNVSRDSGVDNFASFYKYIITKAGFNGISFNPANYYNTSQDHYLRDQRLKWYLKCSQLGRFHISNGFRSDEINEQYYTTICASLFQMSSLDQINQTRVAYGGQNYSGTSALFTRSANDLNYDLMPNSTFRYNVRVIEAPNSRESFDLLPLSKYDSVQVIISRQLIHTLMVSWLSNECEEKCSHGKCILNKCVCDDPWSNDFCTTKLISLHSLNIFSTVATLLPTIILIILGMIGWYIFVVKGAKARFVI